MVLQCLIGELKQPTTATQQKCYQRKVLMAMHLRCKSLYFVGVLTLQNHDVKWHGKILRILEYVGHDDKFFPFLFCWN